METNAAEKFVALQTAQKAAMDRLDVLARTCFDHQKAGVGYSREVSKLQQTIRGLSSEMVAMIRAGFMPADAVTR